MTTVVAVVAAISIVVYGGYLAKRIENRFAGRRWNIPSTVYSDTTLLYPGQKVNRPFFSEKLRRLGYREVSRALQRSGQMLFSQRHIDIFLHALFLSRSVLRCGSDLKTTTSHRSFALKITSQYRY
jgi:penicillin-binding protein 1B